MTDKNHFQEGQSNHYKNVFQHLWLSFVVLYYVHWLAVVIFTIVCVSIHTQTTRDISSFHGWLSKMWQKIRVTIFLSFENCIQVVKSSFLTLASLWLLSKWKHSHWQIFEDLRADCIISIPKVRWCFLDQYKSDECLILFFLVSFLKGLEYTNAPCWVVTLFCNIQHTLYLKSD